MSRFYSGLIFIVIALSISLAGCTDPAAGKAKAITKEATAVAATSNTIESEKIKITAEGSKLTFIGSHIGSAITGGQQGAFEKFSGTITLLNAKPENSQVAVEIEMSSVTTQSGGLAQHLKTPDFFDVAKYPKATFISTEIKPSSEKGATHLVTGNLELHGVKKAITFPAKIEVTKDAVVVNSEFTINRKDFGMTYDSQTIRDEVVLKLAVRASRSKS